MNTNNFFIFLFKVGIALLLAGKLTVVTFQYALKVAKEQQSGLLNLGTLSRELEQREHHKKN